MNKISVDEIRRSLVDVSEYDVTLGGPDAEQSPALLARVADRIGLEAGYCVCYGTNKVLARHGLDLHRDAETAYALLESIFKGALARLDLQQFNVTPWAMTSPKLFWLAAGWTHASNVIGPEKFKPAGFNNST